MRRYDPEHMPLVLPRRTPIAWTSPKVKEVAASGVDSFYRRTRLKLDTDQNPQYLNDALRLADMAIEQTAAALNVKPISYKWFLYHGTSPDNNELFDSSSHPLIPDGFSLVAGVENIFPTTEPTPAVQAELAERILAAPRLGGLVLGDLNIEHVAFDSTGQGRLVDVDADVAGIASEYYFAHHVDLGMLGLTGY